MAKLRRQGTALVPKKKKHKRKPSIPEVRPQVPPMAPERNVPNKETDPDIFWPKPNFMSRSTDAAQLVQITVMAPTPLAENRDTSLTIHSKGDIIIALKQQGHLFSMALIDEVESTVILHQGIEVESTKNSSLQGAPWRILGEHFARTAKVSGQIRIIGSGPSAAKSNSNEFVVGILKANSQGLSARSHYQIVETKVDQDIDLNFLS